MADTYIAPAFGWTCFHCGETFTTIGAARDHFGSSEHSEPGCMIRVQIGEERGLLMALRRAEDQLARYRNEDSDADRAMGAMVAKHATELRTAEEAGYAKGLRDAKAEASAQGKARDAVIEAARSLRQHIRQFPYRDIAGLRLSDVVIHVQRFDDALSALAEIEREAGR